MTAKRSYLLAVLLRLSRNDLFACGYSTCGRWELSLNMVTGAPWRMMDGPMRVTGLLGSVVASKEESKA